MALKLKFRSVRLCVGRKTGEPEKNPRNREQTFFTWFDFNLLILILLLQTTQGGHLK